MQHRLSCVFKTRNFSVGDTCNIYLQGANIIYLFFMGKHQLALASQKCNYYFPYKYIYKLHLVFNYISVMHLMFYIFNKLSLLFVWTPTLRSIRPIRPPKYRGPFVWTLEDGDPMHEVSIAQKLSIDEWVRVRFHNINYVANCIVCDKHVTIFWVYNI